MYSKKIMKHFLHPKFHKKLKKFNGVGQVGNPTCLLPKEQIHKNSENIEISKLKKNQKILSHNGSYEKIISTSLRRYNGNIIVLKNKLGKISLTPEHLIFAIKKPKNNKFLRTKHKKTLTPAWYHVNQLVRGDLILYPILKEENDVDYIEFDIPKLKWDFKSKDIPKKIPLNSDFLRLCGYFLSEGNIQDKPCKTYISFSLNIKEKDIIEDIRKISKDLFGLDIKIKEESKRKTTKVLLYNAKLARFFKKLFRNGAANKRIPNFIMSLPAEKQKFLIYGLWRGDGYININRIGPRGGFATISYQLCQQIKLLLLRQRIVPSIYEEKEKKIKGVYHKKAYRIHVGQRESLKRLCDILKINYFPKSYESIGSWFDKDYLYIPITKKEIFDYNGNVHNLEVNNAHSFVSEAFCLHNCGDIMKIYIYVKDDKIKDISFETMGCVAAIASSDALCELAKGKTITQALKITDKQINSYLGKLPSIKLHCSVLGRSALKKAIEDYERRKK